MSNKKRKKSKEIRKDRFVEKVDETAIVIKPAGSKEKGKTTANQVNPELTRIAQDAYTEAVRASWDEENERQEKIGKGLRDAGKQVPGANVTRPRLNPDGSLA